MWSVPTGRARVPAIAVFDEPCVAIAVVGSGAVWAASRSGRLAALEFQSDAPQGPGGVGPGAPSGGRPAQTRHTGEIFPDDYGEYSQELLAALSTLQVVGYPQWAGDASRASRAPTGHPASSLAKSSGTSTDGFAGGAGGACAVGPSPRLTGRLTCLAFEADRMWGARGSGKRIHSWAVSSPDECEVWDADDLGALVAVTSAASGGIILTCHRHGGLQLWDRLGMRLRFFRSPSPTEPVEMAVCAGLVCVGHRDGTLRLWSLSADGLDDSGKGLDMKVVGSLVAHRSGLLHCMTFNRRARKSKAPPPFHTLFAPRHAPAHLRAT